MPNNNIITTAFTFTAPDEQFSTSTSNNVTVNAEYTGPDKWYVFVDETTGIMSQGMWPTLTDENDGADVGTPAGALKVMINSADDPFIASIIDPNGYSQSTARSTVTETITLADDSTADYSYDWPQSPDEIVDRTTIRYADGAWTHSFIEAEVTWDDVRSARDTALESSDYKVPADMPDDLKATWVAYRAALRALPANWIGQDAHKVIFPESPENSA